MREKSSQSMNTKLRKTYFRGGETRVMKKTLSSILVFALVLTMLVPAFAFAADKTPAQMVEELNAKYENLFVGDQNGNLDYEGKVQRDALAKILAIVAGLEVVPPAADAEPMFSDVADNWAYLQGYIGAANKAGYLNGVGDDKFNPRGDVNYAMLATVIARVLDVEVKDATPWYAGNLAAVQALGFMTDVTVEGANAVAPRSALVFAAYVADQNLEPEVPVVLAKIESAAALTNTVVEVTLAEAVTSVDAADFSIVDADDKDLEVKGATLIDEKTVELETAAQTTAVVYTVSANGTSAKFVGQVADSISPQLLAATATKNTEVTLTFNEEVGRSAMNIANYKVEGLSVLKAEYGVDGNGDTDKTLVVLTTSSQTQGTVYTLVVSNVTDLSGNAVDTDNDEAQFGGLPVDDIKPQVTSAFATTNTTVTVDFNEDLDQASAELISNYAIEGLSVLKAELQSNGDDVVLTTSSQTQGTVYKLVVKNVKDESGNVLDSNFDEATFGGLPVDDIKPQVTSAFATGNTKVTVDFNEDLDKESAENIANYSIEGLTVLKAELQTNKDDVVLTTSSQTQGTVYKLVVTNVKDLSGNVVNSNNDEATFGGLPVDDVKPTVSSAHSVDNTHVVVVFSEVVDSATASKGYNYYLGSELGYPTRVAKVTAADNVAFGTVFATDGSAWLLTTKAQAAKVYTVDVTGVKDQSGNVLDENNDEATFGGTAGAADSTAPKVSSATALNNNTITVTFNEALAKASVHATDFVFAVVSGTETATNPIAAQTADAIVVSEDNKSVTLQFDNETMTSGVVYRVTVSNLTDAAGNGIGGTGNTATFAGTNAANPAPKVASAILINNQTLKIIFSEEVVQVGGSSVGTDFTVASGTGAPAFTGEFVSAVLAADSKSITVYYNDGGSSEATDKFAAGKLYSVTVNGAEFTDVLGLVQLSTTNNANLATFSGITSGATAPKISAIVAVDQNTIDIVFDQPVTSVLDSVYASDLTVSKDGSPFAATDALIRAEGKDGNKVRVFFSGTPFTEGHVYSVALNASKVVNNNSVGMSATANTGTFAAISTVNPAPKAVAVQKTGATTLVVTFSEKIDGTNLNANGSDFAVSGATVTGATLDSTGKKVTLTLQAALTAGIKTLSVVNDGSLIQDEAKVGNVNTTATVDFVY